MELFANPWFLVYFLPAALLAWLVAWSGKKLKNRLISALFGPMAYAKLTADLRPVTWKRGACFGLFLFFLFAALQIDYNLSELKLAIGCVNTQEERVQKELDRPNPDFDYIVNSVAKEKHFDKWYDFRVNVLDVAKRQINEKSDLEIDYEPIRSGRGGKVVGITFFIKKNVNYNEIEAKTEKENEILLKNGNSVVDSAKRPDDYNERFEEIMDYIDVRVSSKDLKAFLKAADYDVERVKKAYDLSKKQKEIKNFVGWMKKAIEEGYSEDMIHIIDGSEENAKKADEILAEYEREKATGSLAERTWNRIKKKEEYQEFLQYIADQGMTEKTLESIYIPKERMELYQNWMAENK